MHFNPDYYFPIFGCVVIFSIWLCYELKKNRRSMDEQNTQFWQRESQANMKRRVSPETLPYIQIPLDTFPIGKYQDETLSACEETLCTLQNKKILNLTGLTSTELKETYGPANLPLLDECDTNYTELSKTIACYGTRLHELGHDEECITVLEFGIAILTDIRSNYKLLAELYAKENAYDKILQLKEAATSLNSLMKKPILELLEQYLTSSIER